MIGRQIHNVSGRSACDEEGKETLAKVPEEMVGWVMLSGGAESGKEVEQGLFLPLHLGALWESELGFGDPFPSISSSSVAPSAHLPVWPRWTAASSHRQLCYTPPQL